MTVFSISDDRLRDLAQDALNVARSVGAADASCEVSETTGLSVTVRKRKVETIEHTRDKGLGVPCTSAAAQVMRRPVSRRRGAAGG
jgi:PmbA protein